MPDIADILKRAKPRETTVAVYLAGDVVAEVEELERRLAGASADTWQAASLADVNPAQDLAQQIADARRRLAESEAVFRFRALDDKSWSDLLASHPPKDSSLQFDPATMAPALLAACCVDPVMTPVQVLQLFAVINQAQRNALFDGAWEVNTEATNVPFSVAASAILAGLTEGK